MLVSSEQLEYHQKTNKKHNLFFYVLRQMLKQKYKYSLFVIFQWILITVFLVLLSGMTGIFDMIEKS